MAAVEVVVIAFPGSTVNDAFLPEVERLVDGSTITIVDGLFVRKLEDGEITWDELEHEVPGLSSLMDHVEGLLAAEDVLELAEDMEPGSAAAVLAFEHTWLTPLVAAVDGAGGRLVADIHVPEDVVEEIYATVPDED